MKARIKFLNARKFKDTSSGEVVEPGTINSRTRYPIPGGILCPKVFGPTKDYRCACTPPIVSGRRNSGVKCEKCGVECLPAISRRNRTGHMVLNTPLIHPLAYELLSNILHVRLFCLEQIVNGILWVGWDPDPKKGCVVLRDGTRASLLIEKNRTLDASKRASMGLFHLIRGIDLESTAHLHTEMGWKTAKFLEKCLIENVSIEDLFITILPVLPVAYRPFLDRGEFIITDSKNDLYTRLIWKVMRMRRFREMFPIFDLEIILQEETTLIQKATNELLVRGVADAKGTPLKSICDYLSGKSGLLRGRMLGKRLDFSGRTVISPGPWLKLDEMGLPIQMALVLFEPWIINWLCKNYVLYTKQAKAIYRSRDPRVYEALEEVVKDKYIIMNRQPTLHRIGMLAFKVRLHSGKSCFLHPMVCAPYNADFDGDQMAVHVPLSKEVQEEIKQLLLPKDNMLSPLDSTPVIGPSHEMIIGTYYMTLIQGNTKRIYNSPQNVIRDHEFGLFPVNAPILLRDDEREYLTCAGRLLIERLFKVEVNEPLTKKALKQLISRSHDIISKEALSIALDKIKTLAYKYVTKVGFSLGMSDFITPSGRDELMAEAQAFADELQEKFLAGKITNEQRVEQKIRCWMNTIQKLQDDFIAEAGNTNPLVVMLKTGARVSMTQVSQLVVAKGMQSAAGGRIIEDPVKNCLVTGLNTFDYFTTCYGARKSMADKKTATPKSGYLARRLVNVTRDLYISVEDCGNVSEGLEMRRCDCEGRTTIDGELITRTMSTEYVKVRSPIFCTATRGICAVCYGIDATKRSRVKVGTPVGVIAAQSLTEPCTQMTMRTFHTSGAAELKDSPLVVRSAHSGTASILLEGDIANIFVDSSKYVVHHNLCKILVDNGGIVKTGDPLAVYTSQNLANEDIGGKLLVLDQYFEMQSPRGHQAVIAQKAGKVQLLIEDSGIGILIGGTVQGKVSDSPIFVHDGEDVRLGQFLSYGEVNVRDYDENLLLAATVFLHRVMTLYREEDVNPYPVHLELIFRGLSELVENEEVPGELGLYRYGDPGVRKILGATEIGKRYPSWLKAIGFGYSKSALTRAIVDFAVNYDLPSERILTGEYPLFDPV
jgi:DNA-directed RNA polymerase subunit beta'